MEGQWERETEGEWEIIKKEYLNVVLKNKSLDVRDIVKWCIIYYKVGFWDGKC